MTVLGSTSRIVQVASAGATVIAVPFKVQRVEDLVVYKTPSGGDAALLTYGTHYSLSGLGEDTCAILLVTAASAGDEYLTFRAVEINQDLSLRNQGPYLPATLEAQLDRITMMIQQLNTLLSSTDPSLARALLLGVADTLGEGAYDALSNRIKNMQDGEGAQDAVSVAQLNAAVAGVASSGGGPALVIVGGVIPLPTASATYDYAVTGIDYLVREDGKPDIVKRCLRQSDPSGTVYDWEAIVSASN